MAELRKNEDQRYMDRTGTDDARDKVLFDGEEQSLQSPTRPQLVPTAESTAVLFSTSDVEDLRRQWGKIQTSFVDEPRWAVQEADKLVAKAMDRLAEGFAQKRTALEKQWDHGEDVSTEDLRLALQRYRAFFDKLLNV